ncbi:MAG: hypothetical protein ACYS9T_03250 [Planctomycetota bacterium]|jgi:hypothetical protein
MRFGRVFIIGGTILTIISGCSSDAESIPLDKTPSAKPGQGRLTREDSQEEPLAVMILRRRDKDEIVNLPNDYGFLVRWNGADGPEFCLYEKARRRIRCTADFSTFLAGLKEFPAGAKVDRLRKCSAPFEWGMPKAKHQRLEEVIQAKGFKLTGIGEGNFTICTCMCTGIKVLKTADHPEFKQIARLVK